MIDKIIVDIGRESVYIMYLNCYQSDHAFQLLSKEFKKGNLVNYSQANKTLIVSVGPLAVYIFSASNLMRYDCLGSYKYQSTHT